MGRQTQLHMLAADCKQMVDFIRNRDPVIVVHRDADSARVEECECPWAKGGTYCLWNQSLLPSLERDFIPKSNVGPYYRINDALPIVELFFPNPNQESWNGKPALTQGRVYTGVNSHKGKSYESWYNAIVYWVRKRFRKNPVPHLGGFVGPVAYEWYQKGGTLLPMLRPPITPQWLSWVEAQDQHRALFSND